MDDWQDGEHPTNRGGPDSDELVEPDEELDALEEADDQIELVAAGDVDAFKLLFDAYFDRLYRYALRYLHSPEEAADSVHDVFLQVWRHRQRIGLERDLRTYLYASTRNHALDRLKRRKVEDRFREHSEAALARKTEAEVGEAELDLESRELEATIQRAVDALPRRQREVLRLRWLDHLSYDEIARTLGISPKTVAIHMARGFRRLREALPGTFD